jgi:hypothetical protein
MGRDWGDPVVLTAVRRLLSLYPGVTVDTVRVSPKGFSIWLRITDRMSLGRLAHCANNVNIAFQVCGDPAAKGATDPEWASPDRIEFLLHDKWDQECVEINTFHLLCHCIAHQLLRLGLLDMDQLLRLLRDAGYPHDDDETESPTQGSPNPA